MKLAHLAIGVLVSIGTVGAAAAQTPAPCSAADRAEGNVTMGNRTVLNPAMNAMTDVPAVSRKAACTKNLW